MRNKYLLLALAVLFLPPAPVGAATLDQLTGTADCNAWSSEVTIAFRPGADTVLLVFNMVLSDSGGATMDSLHWEQWLEIPATATATYPFGAAWQAPLTAAATMVVTADVYDARGDTFNLTQGDVVVALACGDTGGSGNDVCRHASRWWLRHRAQWPVTSLGVGHLTYDAPQIVRLLRSPHRGLVGHRLAHQLVVSKLNLANGATGDIAATVAAADAWLVAHPLDARGRHREPRHGERREALRMIKELCRWNHSGCSDGSQLLGDDGDGDDKGGLTVDFGDPSQEFTGDLADYDASEKAAEETTSLGALKAMFR